MAYVLNVSYKGFLTIADSFARLFKESNIFGYNLWRLFDQLCCHGRYLSQSQRGWMTRDRHVGKWILQCYCIAKKILDEKKRHRCDLLFAKDWLEKPKYCLLTTWSVSAVEFCEYKENFFSLCSLVGGGTQKAHAISRNIPGPGSVHKWTKRKTKNNNKVKY